MQILSTRSKIIGGILAYLVSAIIFVGTALLGLLLKDNFDENLGNIFYAITLFIFLICLILNIVLSGSKKKKIKQMKVTEIHELFRKRKEDIKSSLDQATKRLHKVAFCIKLYIVFIMIVTYISVFFFGFLFGVNGEFVIFLIVMYFLTQGIYARFFGAILNRPNFKQMDIISQDSFAQLYSIASSAMKTVEINGTLYISVDNSFDASISQQGNSYILNLGCNLVNSLSTEELYNVFLHEFAHVSKSYTPKSIYGLFHKFMEFNAVELGAPIDFLILYPLAIYEEEFALYAMCASEYIESMADSVVVKKGNPKAFVAALAKGNLYGSYERVLYLYLKPMFAKEEVQEDIATQYLEGFRLAMRDNMHKWLDSYENEIQPRNASHPIYRVRREAVGVSKGEVEISFNDDDISLKEERAKLLDYTNKLVMKNLKPHYEQSRKHYYLEPLGVVEAWEKDKNSYNTNDLSLVIDALAALNRHREAEKICDQIIQSTENIYATTYAKFFKGFMLLNDDNDAGIDLLYQVIEQNFGYFEECLGLIGEYACRNGKQKELDEYRAKVEVLFQKSIDVDSKANVLNPRDNLVADTMDDSILNKHIEFILSTSSKIKSIYLVRKIINSSFYSRVFLIEFEKTTNFDEIKTNMDKIFRYLDTFDGERYSLFLINPRFKNIVKKVKGSLVYSK